VLFENPSWEYLELPADKALLNDVEGFQGFVLVRSAHDFPLPGRFSLSKNQKPLILCQDLNGNLQIFQSIDLRNQFLELDECEMPSKDLKQFLNPIKSSKENPFTTAISLKDSEKPKENSKPFLKPQENTEGSLKPAGLFSHLKQNESSPFSLSNPTQGANPFSGNFSKPDGKSAFFSFGLKANEDGNNKNLQNNPFAVKDSKADQVKTTGQGFGSFGKKNAEDEKFEKNQNVSVNPFLNRGVESGLKNEKGTNNESLFSVGFGDLQNNLKKGQNSFGASDNQPISGVFNLNNSEFGKNSEMVKGNPFFAIGSSESVKTNVVGTQNSNASGFFVNKAEENSKSKPYFGNMNAFKPAETAKIENTSDSNAGSFFSGTPIADPFKSLKNPESNTLSLGIQDKNDTSKQTASIFASASQSKDIGNKTDNQSTSKFSFMPSSSLPTSENKEEKTKFQPLTITPSTTNQINPSDNKSSTSENNLSSLFTSKASISTTSPQPQIKDQQVTKTNEPTSLFQNPFATSGNFQMKNESNSTFSIKQDPSPEKSFGLFNVKSDEKTESLFKPPTGLFGQTKLPSDGGLNNSSSVSGQTFGGPGLFGSNKTGFGSEGSGFGFSSAGTEQAKPAFQVNNSSKLFGEPEAQISNFSLKPETKSTTGLFGSVQPLPDKKTIFQPPPAAEFTLKAPAQSSGLLSSQSNPASSTFSAPFQANPSLDPSSSKSSNLPIQGQSSLFSTPASSVSLFSSSKPQVDTFKSSQPITSNTFSSLTANPSSFLQAKPSIQAPSSNPSSFLQAKPSIQAPSSNPSNFLSASVKPAENFSKISSNQVSFTGSSNQNFLNQSNLNLSSSSATVSTIQTITSTLSTRIQSEMKKPLELFKSLIDEQLHSEKFLNSINFQIIYKKQQETFSKVLQISQKSRHFFDGGLEACQQTKKTWELFNRFKVEVQRNRDEHFNSFFINFHEELSKKIDELQKTLMLVNNHSEFLQKIVASFNLNTEKNQGSEIKVERRLEFLAGKMDELRLKMLRLNFLAKRSLPDLYSTLYQKTFEFTDPAEYKNLFTGLIKPTESVEISKSFKKTPKFQYKDLKLTIDFTNLQKPPSTEIKKKPQMNLIVSFQEKLKKITTEIESFKSEPIKPEPESKPSSVSQLKPKEELKILSTDSSFPSKASEGSSVSTTSIASTFSSKPSSNPFNPASSSSQSSTFFTSESQNKLKASSSQPFPSNSNPAGLSESSNKLFSASSNPESQNKTTSENARRPEETHPSITPNLPQAISSSEVKSSHATPANSSSFFVSNTGNPGNFSTQSSSNLSGVSSSQSKNPFSASGQSNPFGSGTSSFSSNPGNSLNPSKPLSSNQNSFFTGNINTSSFFAQTSSAPPAANPFGSSGFGQSSFVAPSLPKMDGAGQKTFGINTNPLSSFAQGATSGNSGFGTSNSNSGNSFFMMRK
jgi:hypothetical protein